MHLLGSLSARPFGGLYLIVSGTYTVKPLTQDALEVSIVLVPEAHRTSLMPTMIGVPCSSYVSLSICPASGCLLAGSASDCTALSGTEKTEPCSCINLNAPQASADLPAGVPEYRLIALLTLAAEHWSLLPVAVRLARNAGRIEAFCSALSVFLMQQRPQGCVQFTQGKP